MRVDMRMRCTAQNASRAAGTHAGADAAAARAGRAAYATARKAREALDICEMYMSR